MVWWDMIWQARTTKWRGQFKLLLRHVVWDSNPNWYTIQGTHYALWIGAWVSNPGLGLVPTEVAPLCYCFCYCGDLVNFLVLTCLEPSHIIIIYRPRARYLSIKNIRLNTVTKFSQSINFWLRTRYQSLICMKLCDEHLFCNSFYICIPWDPHHFPCSVICWQMSKKEHTDNRLLDYCRIASVTHVFD